MNYLQIFRLKLQYLENDEDFGGFFLCHFEHTYFLCSAKTYFIVASFIIAKPKFRLVLFQFIIFFFKFKFYDIFYNHLQLQYEQEEEVLH